MNAHAFNAVIQAGIHTTEPLVLQPSTFENERFLKKSPGID
jgi:hypothetical protein